MINELTIITTLIKSKSRKIQLDRFLNFHLKLKCNIIVIKPENIEIDYKSNNKYVRIINCPKNASQSEKFQLAYNSVKTPYISWVADDDFLGIDFAKKSIQILNDDLNISACDGLTIFQDEGTAERKNHVYSFEYYKAGLNSYKFNLNRADILKYNAVNFNPAVVHGIIRTNIFIEGFEFLIRNNIPIRWCDSILIFIFLMHGKIHYIKSISGIRSYDTRLLDNDIDSYSKNVEIPVTQLIMDQELINKLYDYYISLKGKISPKITACILYYLLYSSRALENARERKYSKFKKYFMITRSYLEVLKLRFLNPQINEDIKLAKKLMKEYSLKGK